MNRLGYGFTKIRGISVKKKSRWIFFYPHVGVKFARIIKTTKYIYIYMESTENIFCKLSLLVVSFNHLLLEEN